MILYLSESQIEVGVLYFLFSKYGNPTKGKKNIFYLAFGVGCRSKVLQTGTPTMWTCMYYNIRVCSICYAISALPVGVFVFKFFRS